MTRVEFAHVVMIALAFARARAACAQADSAGGGDPVSIAASEAQKGWSARTVRTGDAVVFPYGRVQPTVTCAPLRACAIALEPGEVVLGKASGDAERWLIEQTKAGPGGATALIIVKPIACSLATNLVVSTDRRVYDVSLVSPPCAGRAGGFDAESTRMVRFYYPDPGQISGDSTRSASSVDGTGVRPAALRFDYVVRVDKRVRWAPIAVYDDGVRTYVRFSADMVHGPLPFVRAVTESGAPELVNYSVENNALVVDRVIERAELVMGDDNGRRVQIVNTRLVAER